MVLIFSRNDSLWTEIFLILNNPDYDSNDADPSTTELIEELITNDNWYLVLKIFVDILLDYRL